MSAPVDRGKPEAAGELRGKSVQELTEILERQEKLLRNKNFVAKLPDRGKKILDYTEKVQAAIAEHNREKKTTDLLSAFKLQFQEQQCNIKENAETSEDLEDKVTPASTLGTKAKENSSHHANAISTKFAHSLDTISFTASVKTNEENYNNPHTDENTTDALVNGLKMISIKERGDHASKVSSETALSEKTDPFPGTSGANKSHFIEVLERRSICPILRKERFRTNRLPSDSNSSSPNQSPGDKALRMSAEERKLYDRKHLDDITSARLPPLHHSPAQLLPLEESLALQIEQKNIYDEKQAKLAAQKLFEKLNIKMGPFNPEGDPYKKYRDDTLGAEE
ncbi:protein GRINL1A [Rhinoderma darwinii]|uniref:protein GRINL1A n=1 Tax=Rhinoderma darwinii TaxID=43563 RepID=UPI003F670BDE